MGCAVPGGRKWGCTGRERGVWALAPEQVSLNCKVVSSGPRVREAEAVQGRAPHLHVRSREELAGRLGPFLGPFSHYCLRSPLKPCKLLSFSPTVLPAHQRLLCFEYSAVSSPFLTWAGNCHGSYSHTTTGSTLLSFSFSLLLQKCQSLVYVPGLC